MQQQATPQQADEACVKRDVVLQTSCMMTQMTLPSVTLQKRDVAAALGTCTFRQDPAHMLQIQPTLALRPPRHCARQS